MATRYDNISKAYNRSNERASKYAYSKPKEILPVKRSKYSNIPVTNSEGKLNFGPRKSKAKVSLAPVKGITDEH